PLRVSRVANVHGIQAALAFDVQRRVVAAALDVDGVVAGAGVQIERRGNVGVVVLDEGGQVLDGERIAAAAAVNGDGCGHEGPADRRRRQTSDGVIGGAVQDCRVQRGAPCSWVVGIVYDDVGV